MKKDTAARLFLHQYIDEAEDWHRLLANRKEELLYFKSRLTEAINTLSNNDLLSRAEVLQEALLAQDRIFDYMTKEVEQQTRLLKNVICFSADIPAEILQTVDGRQKNLQRDFVRAEELYAQSKTNFTDGLELLY
jgi:hypothetical protein